MVEMPDVFTIIAILSIGGIAGYRRGMVADEIENKTDVTIFFDINADTIESFPDSKVTQPETTSQMKCTEHTDCKPNEYCDRSVDNCHDGKPVFAPSGHYCRSIEVLIHQMKNFCAEFSGDDSSLKRAKFIPVIEIRNRLALKYQSCAPKEPVLFREPVRRP